MSVTLRMRGLSRRRAGLLKGRIRRIVVYFCAAFVVGFSLVHAFGHRDFDLSGARQLASRKRTVAVSGDPSGHIKVSKSNSVSKGKLSAFMLHLHAKEFGE